MSPVVFCKRAELREFLEARRREGKSVGFVPTMGALHEGHATLLRRSASENDVTVLSIFVNPKQFGPNEDFSRYPRTFPEDVELARQCGVTCVFSPSASEMYPDDFATQVAVPKLSGELCGRFRPGHFDGVCTVVLLLLNQVGADRAYFGLKDFQQYVVLSRMCRDLAHPTEIVPVPTVREADGLAMSSRNRYLTRQARALARTVPLSLAAAANLFRTGERGAEALLGAARRVLADVGLEPQYLELRDFESLEVVSDRLNRPALLAIAQPIESDGVVRLIDNVVLSDDGFWARILDDLLSRTR